MHELPVTQSILNIVLKHAKKNRLTRVISITLHMGQLSDIEDPWLQHYFDYLSKKTIAEGAKLIIERLPIIVRCRNCEETLHINKEDLGVINCSNCGTSGNFSLVSGRQYCIKEMEAI